MPNWTYEDMSIATEELNNLPEGAIEHMRDITYEFTATALQDVPIHARDEKEETHQEYRKHE